MNLSFISCFVCIWFSSVLCAPTKPENSFYAAIVQKCPSVHSDPAYKNQAIFRACEDWKTISEVDKFTQSNGKEIRCLFYFSSFTEYCAEAPKVNTTVPRSDLGSYRDQIDVICNYAKDVSNKNLSTIFSNKEDCKSICSDDVGFVESLCGMSYYFAHSKVEPLSGSPHFKEIGKKVNTISEQSEVPSPVQLNKTAISSLIPVRSQASRVNNTGSSGLGGQSPPAQGVINSDQGNNAPPQERNNQNGLMDESNVNHDIDNEEHPAIPQGVVKPSVTKAVLPNEAPDADHQLPVQEEHQEPGHKVSEEVEEGGQVANPEGSVVGKPVGGQVDAEFKPPTEGNHNMQDSKNMSAKTATQNNVGDKKEANSPPLGPPVFESDNQEQPDLDDDEKQTAQLQQNSNQDIDVDEDGQMPEGQDDDNMETPINPPILAKETESKPMQTDESEAVNYNTEMEGDSYFFTYFMLLCIIFIVGYVCYHNKQKVLALILEGRKGRRQYRGRRPNSANYHKLDSNLEEAITSTCKKNTNNVIY